MVLGRLIKPSAGLLAGQVLKHPQEVDVEMHEQKVFAIETHALEATYQGGPGDN